MDIKDIEKKAENFKSKIQFDYELKKTNWFNIGGKTKIFFKPENLQELVDFLKLYNERGKIFIIGAGSNILFNDNIFNGVVIKLGKKFSNLSLLNKNTIIAGSSVLDKHLSEFAMENNIGGFEFLSCIPGSIGGGIRMNSGCFKREFKDIIISVQAIDSLGKVLTIPAKKINFEYRKCDLPNNLIFLSATFIGKKKKSEKIYKEIIDLKNKKEISQPTKIKTGGSTFKNPLNQTDKKVWKLIEESVSPNIHFGEATISEKHRNFFVNKGNAKCEDMKKLINYVKDKVMSKTGVNLELEIILVE